MLVTVVLLTNNFDMMSGQTTSQIRMFPQPTVLSILYGSRPRIFSSNKNQGRLGTVAVSYRNQGDTLVNRFKFNALPTWYF